MPLHPHHLQRAPCPTEDMCLAAGRQRLEHMRKKNRGRQSYHSILFLVPLPIAGAWIICGETKHGCRQEEDICRWRRITCNRNICATTADLSSPRTPGRWTNSVSIECRPEKSLTSIPCASDFGSGTHCLLFDSCSIPCAIDCSYVCFHQLLWRRDT